MKTSNLLALAFAAIAGSAVVSAPALASGEAPHIERQSWSFAASRVTTTRPSCSAASRSTSRSARPVTGSRVSASAT